MTVAELNRKLIDSMAGALGPEGARAAMRIMWEDVMHYSQSDMIIRGSHQLEPFTVKSLSDLAAKVVDGEPVQYAVGSARFMGMDLKVDRSTLIPRPETAGLVDLITDYAGDRQDLNVLDIGTGSGCIAIALARALRFAHIDAVDVSDQALALASENAVRLNARVNFKKADALTMVAPTQPEYDIIVSNPPYVLESERSSMDSRVVDYEPASALFVPDDDPLKFYIPIANYASRALKSGGALFFEINPLEASSIDALLRSRRFSEVQVLRDYKGTNRYIKAIWA